MTRDIDQLITDWNNATPANPLRLDDREGDMLSAWLKSENRKPIASSSKLQSYSFKPFVSPLDGKRIASSKQLTEHNNRYQVQQVGNEFKNKRKDFLEKSAVEKSEHAKENVRQQEYLKNPEIKEHIDNFIKRNK